MAHGLTRHLTRTLAAITFVLALLATSLATRAARFGEHIETFNLDNGMEIVVIPDHRAPVVTHMVWYRVGSADEPPGKSGIAHYLEHLMFKGTKKYPDGIFSKMVAEIGGQENAFTSTDYTGYFQRVAKEHLAMVMELEADRMTNLVLTEDNSAAELQVVLEERRSRVENSPGAQLGEALDAALFMSHPYGRPIIGWRHEIETLTAKDAIEFYEQYYTPNNAILIVAGDVEPDEVLELARKTYGTISVRAEPGKRLRPTEPPHLAPRTVTLAHPRVDQEGLRRAYLVPSYTTAEGSEADALGLLSTILGRSSTSRLYKTLVLEQKVATSAGSYYSGTALDDSTLTVYAVPAPGTDLEALEAAMDKVIADLLQNGVSEEELERTKRNAVASTIYAQDSQSSLARVFGTALTTGSTVEREKTWIDRVQKVTAEEVLAVARKYLKLEGSATGYLRKATEGERS